MGKLGTLFDYEEFWVLLLDVIVSAVLYFTGKYALPAIAEDVAVLIALMQPIALFVVAAISKVKKAKIEAMRIGDKDTVMRILSI